MTAQLARINWLRSDQGGRLTPPEDPRFIIPARFANAAEQWSIVLELISRPADSTEWIASVHFLVEAAPHELLTEGATIELHEGKKCVAQGSILSQEPAHLNAIIGRLSTAETHLTN